MPKKTLRTTATNLSASEFAVVVAMLDFYGLPYSTRSIGDYLHHHNYGILMTEIADCLLQHGLTSTFVSADPNLFSRPAWNALYLQDYPQVNPSKLPTVNELDRIVAKGVLLRRLLPSKEIIDKELEADRPVVISYDPAMLESIRAKSVSQAIISAKTDEEYTVFEPHFGNTTTNYPKESVILAITQLTSLNPTAKSIILTSEKLPTPTEPPPPLPEI
jgi:hypothetical protein